MNISKLIERAYVIEIELINHGRQMLYTVVSSHEDDGEACQFDFIVPLVGGICYSYRDQYKQEDEVKISKKSWNEYAQLIDNKIGRADSFHKNGEANVFTFIHSSNDALDN
jgi:hypothetical protein